ncbi:unnamed protein product [Dibothriocephalus latus]|uniref:Uncharacterized protein n=1 Tax=Dibothriocephalus latus TaxID=60516 RepID=A0A3P7NY62_DIBLA|nr:unnamed protein product [Dibothriocephalus latus]
MLIFTLIESKRAGIRLSELFNGGPVNPSDAIPPPVHSSFDAHNRLLPTPVSVSDAPDLPIEVPPPASSLKKQDSPPLASTPPQAPATLTTPSASVIPLPTSLFGTSATQLPPTPPSRPVLSVSTPPAQVKKKKGFDDEPAVDRSGLAVRSLAAVSEICDDLIADLVNDQILQVNLLSVAAFLFTLHNCLLIS